MKEEMLKTIKQEYHDMEKIAHRDYSEITELEKDSKVQRYIYLNKLKNDYDIVEYGDKHIVDTLMKKYGQGLIESTNDMWFRYLETTGKFTKKYGLSDANKFDDNEPVVIYLDIEDTSKVVVLKKEEQEEFEKTHNIVHGDLNIVDCSGRYYNTRHKFFDLCLKENQEAAVKRLLKK